MDDNFAIQLFEGKRVRIVWDAEQEKYYFSVVDIVQVLTDSILGADIFAHIVKYVSLRQLEKAVERLEKDYLLCINRSKK